MADTATSNGDRDGAKEGGFGSVLRIRIELWLVVVFMALAFGAGIVVTALYQQPEQQTVVGFNSGGQSVLAPPLTDQQIQQGLPSGHPSLTGSTGSGGGQTGKAGNGGNGKDATTGSTGGTR